MLEAVLPPIVAAYAIFVLMVVATSRTPVPRPPDVRPWLGARRRGMVRHLATTAVGGYVVFIAIVTIFHAWLGDERDALESALTEGSLLTLVVLAVFSASVLRRPTRSGPTASR